MEVRWSGPGVEAVAPVPVVYGGHCHSGPLCTESVVPELRGTPPPCFVIAFLFLHFPEHPGKLHTHNLLREYL